MLFPSRNPVPQARQTGPSHTPMKWVLALSGGIVVILAVAAVL